MELTKLAYYPIFGKPLIFYGGIISYLLFVITALLPLLNQKGIFRTTIKWHKRAAYLALTMATIHGLLGILSYL